MARLRKLEKLPANALVEGDWRAGMLIVLMSSKKRPSVTTRLIKE